MSAASEIAAALGGKPNGSGWMAPCPCHMDDNPSLSIHDGVDGKALLKCHAGCTQHTVSQWARDNGHDLSGKRRRPANSTVAEYDYCDRSGALRYQVVRRWPKGFQQRQPDGKGGWQWNMKDAKPLPYRLPEMLAAPEKPVFVCEGEKDADRLTKEGLVATTNHGGAGKWRSEICRWFKDRVVAIVPDNDEPGRKHAEDVARKLSDFASSVCVVELPGLPEKGDVSDWLDVGHTVRELRRLVNETPAWKPSETDFEPQGDESEPQEATGVALDDFRAYMPQHSYIFAPVGDMWPAASVNARIAPVPVLDERGEPVLNERGEPKRMQASTWLDKNRPVEQMTWWPGEPQVIANRLVSDAGWIKREGASCFNLYRPPTIVRGIAGKARRWLWHVERLYPDDHPHIVRFLAHRVQRPAEKINHALVLGGGQGIGKDTALEPVKYGVGHWNWKEITPVKLTETFNPFAKSVVLRINEAHDLGDLNRYQFYEATKTYIAAPPDSLPVNEKNLRQYYVSNVCGVIITTNHKMGGLYLPPDDRRHFVAWSNLKEEDFKAEYWQRMWRWYYAGGLGHVVAHLAELDISGFDPKAPPPKTAAWWAIVDADRSSEDIDIANTIDRMKNPDAFTAKDLVKAAPTALGDWLSDRKNRRIFSIRLEKCGYGPVRNEDAKDALWKIDGERVVVYARSDMTVQAQLDAVRRRREDEQNQRGKED